MDLPWWRRRVAVVPLAMMPLRQPFSEAEVQSMGR